MTLAAVKKMAVRLSPQQRMKLVDSLVEITLRPLRKSVTLAELEARIDEVESGQVKAVSGHSFETELAALEKGIGQKRSKR